MSHTRQKVPNGSLKLRLSSNYLVTFIKDYSVSCVAKGGIFLSFYLLDIINGICTRSVVIYKGDLLEGQIRDRYLKQDLHDGKNQDEMSQVEHGYSHTYTPPGWLPVRASEDWRQISVKPAAAATPAAVVLMQ